MTEKETNTGRRTEQQAPDQGQPEDRSQAATPPPQQAAKQQEAAVSGQPRGDLTKRAVWTGAAKAIEEGVGYVGEKAPEVASVVIHKVRKGVSAAYGTSSTFVREAYHAASEYADTYKHKVEIKRLKADREAAAAMLGSKIYTRVVVDEEPPEKVFLDQGITSLLERMKNLDREVVKVGEGLEKH